jgi:uncharacterized protein YjgD (DUF1641 family)
MERFDKLRFLLQQAGLLDVNKCLLDVDVSKSLRLLELSGSLHSLSDDNLRALYNLVEAEMKDKNVDLYRLFGLLKDEMVRRGLI